MAGFLERELAELDATGFGVDRQLFADLKAAESRLGPVVELWEEIGSSGGVTMSASRGSRRDGYDILAGILTRHRRAWAERLDDYLRARWDGELRAVAREYNRRTAARAGKPPTLKQFASVGVTAANHWFGGDLARLYAGIGEVTAVNPERIDLLAGDPAAFVREVYRLLGGPPATGNYEQDRQSNLREYEKFADEALRYLQLYECFGRPPTPKEFARDYLEWGLLGDDTERAWSVYCSSIDVARQTPLSAEAVGSDVGQADERAAVPAVAANQSPNPIGFEAPEPSVPPAANPEAPLPDWYADPAGRHQYRYWNGASWTEHVADDGIQAIDTVPRS
jgi:hypothetical protein